MSTRTNSLSRNATLMGTGTILSRITGFGRVFAMGYALGYKEFADTYNLANNIPNIVYELVVGGVLGATLVPVFVREFAQKDDRDAWEGVGAVITSAFVVLLALTVIVLAAAPWIIDLYTIGGSHTASGERSVATFLLRLFAPQLACYGFISLTTGLLQAKRIFGPPMFAPILNNIVVICVLLALPHLTTNATSLEAMQHDSAALWFLGIGTTAGVFAMALLLVPFASRIAMGHLRLHWNPKHSAVMAVLRMSGWTVGFVIANQIALWVTVVLANSGTNGDLAAFLSAYTLFILPHGVFAVSVMSALQPDLAEKWSVGNVEGFRLQLVLGMRLIFAVIIPAAVGYALLANPIVSVVLQHGAVTSHDARRMAHVLFWMVLGLPGFSAFIYLTRALQAMHNARTVFYLYVLENAVNVMTALVLYRVMGVNGLALSQSLAYTLAALVTFLVLRTHTQGAGGKELMRSLIRIVGVTIGMTVIVSIAILVTRGHPFLQVISGVMLGTAMYLLLGKALGMTELRTLLRSRNKK